ncbi:MAG: metal-dependent hydrolase [Pseudomonadales bacterium]|nr:metal-dependent hydrolase [Pseudomonadales bacterium]
MDPITQAVLGAAAPQAAANSKNLKKAGIIGAAAGMSADLDVLIRSSMDPLLFLEYHRQFTHSLIFIPVGALLCALVAQVIVGKRWQLDFKETYLFCILGYATHALLDACTTYGTMLYWPFSDERVAWNTISVIDPVYTVPLLLAVIVAALKNNPWITRLAWIWILLYPTLGLMQNHRAEKVARHYIKDNGEKLISLEAKPSMGNIVLWKIVYETETHYHVDAVRIGLFQGIKEARFFKGDKLEKLDLAEDFLWLDKNSQQAKDIERFRWFSNGYIAKDPVHENRIVDIRYSIIPNEIQPLWSIELDPNAAPEEHSLYLVHRDISREKRALFLKMLWH